MNEKESTDHSSPFQIKSFAMCYCDCLNETCKAEILQLKTVDSKLLAYITFVGQDKRLDDWVQVDCLTPCSAEDESDDSQGEDAVFRYHYDRKSQFGKDFELAHREITKVRNIESITLGDTKMRTWYYSPYPPPFNSISHLYICDKCFQYFPTKELYDKHMQKNEIEPYGTEIYRDGNISIYELRGSDQKISCQCLCLLGKLFLNHKTLYFDVEGFSYYVLVECDDKGCHIAAFSSREVAEGVDNILACIVTFPNYQKKGYGRLLIALSYEIARRRKRPGGPEKPLSDLGEKAFGSFWRDRIAQVLYDCPVRINSVEQLVEITGISEKRIRKTIEKHKFADVLYGRPLFTVNRPAIVEVVKKMKEKKSLELKQDLLAWFPQYDY